MALDVDSTWPFRKSDRVKDVTQQAIDVFLLSKQSSGQVAGIGYWQVANGYTAVALHDLWQSASDNVVERQESKNVDILEDLVSKVGRHQTGYINEYNDDSLWWAHCLFQLYKLSGKIRYLNDSVHIWRYVSLSVVKKGQYTVHGMDMEGGVFWTTRPGEDHLNSITTALYSELSSLLCTVSKDDCLALPSADDLTRAASISLSWILRCRYKKSEAIVTDTIKLRSHELVDWTFTYNTGQAMSACAALYAITKGGSLLSLACDMAEKSMVRLKWVESNGVLTEASAYGPKNHEAWKNDDAVGFKSVLVRALAKLYHLLVSNGMHLDLQGRIKDFVITNFRSLQERNSNSRGQYGPWWNGPMALPTSHSQLAVLDVMAAVMLVESQSR